MYDNWLFFKKMEEEKEKKLIKPVLNNLFSDPFDFHLLIKLNL